VVFGFRTSDSGGLGTPTSQCLSIGLDLRRHTIGVVFCLRSDCEIRGATRNTNACGTFVAGLRVDGYNSRSNGFVGVDLQFHLYFSTLVLAEVCEFRYFTVDAAIVAGFAVSTLILLPEYVLLEVLRSSGLMAETIGLVICVGIGVFFYTLYFSHGLGISIAKSFWLNVLFLVLVVIALIVVVVVLSLVSAMITGLPVDAIVGAPEVSQ
jgi:hypothetical protein